MLWPFLTLLALAAAVVVHLWWRHRFEQVQQEADQALTSLKEDQAQASLQLQAQQEAVFDSMAEGLLLLDEQGRVQLANRAFIQLFGVTSDIRSRTIIEALRLHELAELVDVLVTQ